MEIVKNAKARFEYEILEDIEAGIILNGPEVKSLRQKKVSLVDAYAVFKGDELFIINMRIEPYSHGGYSNPDPIRSRKLLLNKKELIRIRSKLAEKGLTMIPLKLYFKNNKYVKVLLGIGRGKKIHDKRNAIKDKDMKREALRELKHHK